MRPSAPSLASVRLQVGWPGVQLRSELSGGVAPLGYTARWLAVEVLVTVTLTITARGGTAAVIEGTPPSPATGTVSGVPARTGARGIPPMPERVSIIRAGPTPVKRPPPTDGSEASGNQPLTSPTTSTVAAAL